MCANVIERHFRRQTLVFSATLIRDFQWRKKEKSDKKEKKSDKKGAKGKDGKFSKKPKPDDESNLDSEVRQGLCVCLPVSLCMCACVSP